MMARAWGINATMGELFALLYITDDDWTAEDLRSWLKVSRGNVSMNLRELLAWGVVRKIHRAGERRELYHAETDVWTLFRRILTERKRRELDPTLTVLDGLVQLSEDDPELSELRPRVEPLRQFFGMIDGLSVRLMALESRDIIELGQIFAMDDPDSGAFRASPAAYDLSLPAFETPTPHAELPHGASAGQVLCEANPRRAGITSAGPVRAPGCGCRRPAVSCPRTGCPGPWRRRRPSARRSWASVA